MERLKRAWNINSTLITFVLAVSGYVAVRMDRDHDILVHMEERENIYYPKVDALELDMRDVQIQMGLPAHKALKSPKQQTNNP